MPPANPLNHGPSSETKQFFLLVSEEGSHRNAEGKVVSSFHLFWGISWGLAQLAGKLETWATGATLIGGWGEHIPPPSDQAGTGGGGGPLWPISQGGGVVQEKIMCTKYKRPQMAGEN